MAIDELLMSEEFLVIILLMLISFYFLYKSVKLYREKRIIEDIPISKIGSAAQGYNKLKGQQHNIGPIIKSEFTQTPCTWYDCRVKKNVRRFTAKGIRTHSIEIYSNTSKSLILLKDDTGECTIDPNFAEIKSSINISWSGHTPKPGLPPENWKQKICSLFASYSYEEKRMEINSPIYAIGMFQTINTPDISEEIENNDSLPDVMKSWTDNEIKQLDDSKRKINILSSYGLPDRKPFILSSFPYKIITYQNGFDAVFYFLGFIYVFFLSVYFLFELVGLV